MIICTFFDRLFRRPPRPMGIGDVVAPIAGGRIGRVIDVHDGRVWVDYGATMIIDYAPAELRRVG